MQTHYQVLGVGERATAEEIRRAYRALAKALHPDAGGGGGAEAQARFAEAARAYEVLSDRGARRAYDRELEVARENAAPVSSGGHFTWGNIAEPRTAGPGPNGAKGKRPQKDALSEFDEIYETFFGGSG